jgi:hypothetical protein
MDDFETHLDNQCDLLAGKIDQKDA